MEKFLCSSVCKYSMLNLLQLSLKLGWDWADLLINKIWFFSVHSYRRPFCLRDDIKILVFISFTHTWLFKENCGCTICCGFPVLCKVEIMQTESIKSLWFIQGALQHQLSRAAQSDIRKYQNIAVQKGIHMQAQPLKTSPVTPKHKECGDFLGQEKSRQCLFSAGVERRNISKTTPLLPAPREISADQYRQNGFLNHRVAYLGMEGKAVFTYT